jgi:cytochrome c biogenesis protein CcmG, thiol:disulfide interchange protein DsbE
MDTYYTLLEIPTTSSPEEVAAAYQRQRERYSMERVAALGEDIRRIAQARLAALDQAYVVLSDPALRADYDRSVGDAPRGAGQRAPARRGLSRREVLMAAGGALAGLLVIALVWVLSGRGAQPALPPVAELNRPAPDFTLPGLGDTSVRLSDYRGKVVLVNFWGTWCEPCKDETPALQAAYQRLREQGLVIVGVDLRNQERPGEQGDADVRNFTARYGVTYPIALDLAGETGRAFQIYPIPTSYFIDRNGSIRYVRAGPLAADEIEPIFKKLQQEAAMLH